jgi:ATP/maltotriose-dependent transcriptional regulator MalT
MRVPRAVIGGLRVDDYRRLLHVLEASERATTAREFLAGTLAALDEHFGLRSDALVLALAPGRPLRERERACLLALAPHLGNVLRGHLSHELPQGTLSRRESEVAGLVAGGLSNRDIAVKLHIAEDTVKKHIAHAADKLGLDGRTQLAVAWATGTLPVLVNLV